MEPNTLDAARITRAIASGDPGAFGALYEARFDRLYAIARRSTGLCEADCLDIVHDAFLKIAKSVRPMDSERSLDAWLLRMVRSCAYDHLKRERRLREREAAAARRDGEATPSTAELDERLEALRAEISAMDRVTRELFELRHRAGMTLGAIGRVVGLKPGAVDGRIRRAEAGIRARTGENADEV